MSIGSAIYSILSNDETVASIVGTKVFPVDAPDYRGYPYVLYQQISASPNKNKDRVINVKSVRVQIDCFAETYEKCHTLATAVFNALSYYSGSASDITIDIITYEDENDLHDLESKIFRKEQDYIIRIKL